MCSFFPFHTIKWYAINVCNCRQWVIFLFGLFWQKKEQKQNAQAELCVQMFKSSYSTPNSNKIQVPKCSFINDYIILVFKCDWPAAAADTSRLLLHVRPDSPDNVRRLLFIMLFYSHAALTDQTRSVLESSTAGF